MGHALRVLVIDGDDCGLRETIAKWPFVDRVESEVDNGAFDVVVSCHGPAESRPLHDIERAMKPEATLIVNDAVSLSLGNDVAEMVNALRTAIGAPPLAEPSHEPEGVLASLFARFEVIEEKKLGGTLLRHIQGRAQTFLPAPILDMLATFEAAMIDAGVIPSEWNLLAARKRGARVRAVSRPMPRLTEKLEPDPLRLRSRWRTPPQRPTKLEEWHLRLLRIVLHSTIVPRSALPAPGWFEEQPMHSAMERFRFAIANTSAFDWIASRYRAYGDDPVILGLLATFDTLAPQ